MATSPDLESLRLLVRVGELGSLGSASRSEGLAQPSVSKRIATLERRLGVPLLDRTPRGSTLTAEGQVVSDWARGVFAALDDLMTGVEALRAERTAELQVAASMTVAEHLVPGWLAELRRSHPSVHVGLRVANSEEVQDLVRADGVSLGFIETPDVPGDLSSRQVADDRLALVVSPGHPWARRDRQLSPAELAETPLVVRERGSGTRTALEHVLPRVASPLLELGSNSAVKGAVLAGSGPAVLSALAVETEIESGRLVEVPTTGLDLTRRLCAIWPRGRRLTGAPAAFLRIALTHNK